MLSYYFAGAIFTNQQWYFICFIAFVLVSIIMGVFIFLISKWREKHKNNKQKRQPTPLKAFLYGSLVTALLTLLFLVFPAIISDSKHTNKEDKCAKEVGYSNPTDNYSTRGATAESQQAYRSCLNR